MNLYLSRVETNVWYSLIHFWTVRGKYLPFCSWLSSLMFQAQCFCPPPLHLVQGCTLSPYMEAWCCLACSFCTTRSASSGQQSTILHMGFDLMTPSTCEFEPCSCHLRHVVEKVFDFFFFLAVTLHINWLKKWNNWINCMWEKVVIVYSHTLPAVYEYILYTQLKKSCILNVILCVKYKTQYLKMTFLHRWTKCCTRVHTPTHSPLTSNMSTLKNLRLSCTKTFRLMLQCRFGLNNTDESCLWLCAQEHWHLSGHLEHFHQDCHDPGWWWRT